MNRVCNWLVISGLVLGLTSAPAPALAQEVIKTETRLVLVDAVVMGKKGDYLRDLTQKDFKVYEDNKEQSIKSFSFEADPASPTNSKPRYLVLFFDNAHMDTGAQRYAREAAAKFIAANAGPKRLMAVVEYGASLQIATNFTDDVERLKKAVGGVKLGPAGMGETGGSPGIGLSRAAASYGTRNTILALRTLVKNLSGVSGRKSLIMFSGGFKLDEETLSELNQLIDASNQANVAFYPIDARGLVPPAMGALKPDTPRLVAFGVGGFPRLLPGLSLLMLQTRPGGGGSTPGGGSPGVGGGGGSRPPTTSPGTGNGGGTPVRPGGGTTNPGGVGTRPPTNNGGGGVNNNPNNNPNNQNIINQRNAAMMNRGLIMPPTMPSVSDSQGVLHMLANGTGGFVIVNTNDLLGGLEKIGKEQDEHYMIGYSPENFVEGKCHTLKVKITVSGATVRYRTGYCDVKPPDLLSGDPVEKDLEKVIAAAAPGNVKATMRAPFFYTAANSSRMNVSIDVPASMVTFEKKKGKFHGAVNILGVVYREDGGVAARFSDALKFDFDDKKAVEAWQQRPNLHYEKDVEGVPGKYTLKVALSSGAKNVAKIELPLAIDAYDGRTLSMSDVAFSTVTRKIAAASDPGLDSMIAEDRTPLIASGMQLYPSARASFKQNEWVAIYAEMYAPALGAPEPPKDFAAAIQLRVLEAGSGKVVVDSGAMRVADMTPGSPVVPLAFKLPLEKLAPGQYVCELVGADVLGGKGRRATNFSVE